MSNDLTDLINLINRFLLFCLLVVCNIFKIYVYRITVEIDLPLFLTLFVFPCLDVTPNCTSSRITKKNDHRMINACKKG